MAGRGPAPKDPDKRQRRNPREMTEIGSHERAVRAPRLPKIPGRDWHDRTKEWFETWRSSPQASRFATTDWQVLFRIAVLVDEFWSGHLELAGEIRLEEAKLGATPDDRLRIGWRITSGSPDREEVKSGRRRRGTPAGRTRARRDDPRLALVK